MRIPPDLRARRPPGGGWVHGVVSVRMRVQVATGRRVKYQHGTGDSHRARRFASIRTCPVGVTPPTRSLREVR